jgi:hypothetical protein
MASTTTTPTGSLGTETEHEFSLLRKGLLAITGLGIVGILSELIFLRHWEEPLQLVALAAAVVLGVALLMVAFGGTGVVKLGRALAVAVFIASAIGVAVHINVNLEEASQPENWGDAWNSLSPIQQLWEATTGGTGDIPSLAPASLAQTALALLLATIHHPRLKR